MFSVSSSLVLVGVHPTRNSSVAFCAINISLDWNLKEDLGEYYAGNSPELIGKENWRINTQTPTVHRPWDWSKKTRMGFLRAAAADRELLLLFCKINRIENPSPQGQEDCLFTRWLEKLSNFIFHKCFYAELSNTNLLRTMSFFSRDYFFNLLFCRHIGNSTSSILWNFWSTSKITNRKLTAGI